jgi:hypothetical protein
VHFDLHIYSMSTGHLEEDALFVDSTVASGIAIHPLAATPAPRHQSKSPRTPHDYPPLLVFSSEPFFYCMLLLPKLPKSAHTSFPDAQPMPLPVLIST